MTAGELFNTLAQKAGFAADHPALKTLLSDPTLATVNVPDELVTGFDNNILSIDAAKNNHPEIRGKYQSDIYDGVDKLLYRSIEDAGFGEDEMTEIKSANKTTARIEAIISKLKAAKSKPGADKDGLNQKIAELHNELKVVKQEKEDAIKNSDNKIKDFQIKYAKHAAFGAYKTIYDELASEIKNTSMEAIIDKALQDKNARLTIDETGKLQIIGNDGSNVFGDNHIQLTPESFFNKSFAPILKVSSAAPTTAATQNRQQHAPATKAVDEKAEAIVSQISSHNESVLAAMTTGQPSLI
jgi:hypothetical protein